MASLVRQLSQCRIYVQGIHYAGIATEVELPEIEYEMTEYEGLGLVGTPELFAGINAMEASITWSSIHPEIARLLGDPKYASTVQIRSSLATYTGEGLPIEGDYKCIMRLRAKAFAGGTFEKNETTTPEGTYAVDYLQLVVNGAEVLAVDAFDPEGLRVNGQKVNFVGLGV